MLEVWDYVSGAVLVFLTCCLGVYHIFQAKNVKDAREFMFSNPDLGFAPLILSSVATFLSGILLTGFPAETYKDGGTYMLISVSLLILIPFITHLFLPIFFRLGTKTVFEILFTAVAIYAPSLALQQVTGLDFWTSVGSIGVVCILYTTLGGIKAVIWADAAQAVVIVTMMMIVIVKGCYDIGGITKVWQIASEGNKTNIFKFKDDGNSYYTFWTMGVGATIHFLGFLGTNQMLMQRYLSNKSLKDARICFVGSMFGSSFVAGASAFCGLLIYAKFHNCDPIQSNMVTSTDQLMAFYAVETLSFCSGLPGVFVAGLAVGVLCIGGVAVVQSVGGVMKAVFSMVGMVGGPILGIFAIGMLLPWANTIGASAGFVTGLLLTGWATVGSVTTGSGPPAPQLSTAGCLTNGTNFTSLIDNSSVTILRVPNEPFALYTLSPLWYACWCCLSMFTVGTIVSFITGPQDPEKVDPQLLFPFVRKIIRSLPPNVQLRLGFNPQTSVYCRRNQIEQTHDNGRELQKIYIKKTPRVKHEDEIDRMLNST
ncbi:Sodium-coupled monocarboxylate transporter 1 [Chamberlinius hualienensis]